MLKSLKMAIKSIGSNKLRSLLTMLGIIIGVMALVVLVSLVNGATDTVTGTIASLGSDLITVTVKDDKGKPIDLQTLSLWSDYEGVGDICAYNQSQMTIKHGSTADTALIYGATPAYLKVQGLELLLGRFIKSSDIANHTNVCIINETAATELFGYNDCINSVLSIGGTGYTVVGVLADSDTSLTGMFTQGSMIAYIPYTSALRLSSSLSSAVTTFYVSAQEGKDMYAAQSAIEELLLDRFMDDEDAYSLVNRAMLEDAMNDITSILTILLGGIASISLIVGGIGIMNIMLVTVTERTREIGIRKAVGATRGVILQQFLMEAVVLCMMGCFVGIGISWAILSALEVVVSSVGISFALEWNVVLVAVLFCFFIGLIFGLYPANKAAKMQPIDALHYGG